MDKESIKASGLLAAIAESNYQLTCFGDSLRQSKDVVKVSVDFECSRNSNYFDYGTGSPYLFDWYVDFKLADGRALVVIIELAWDEVKWILECRVETPGENGPFSLVDGPEHYANSVDELIDALSISTTEIIRATEKAIKQ